MKIEGVLQGERNQRVRVIKRTWHVHGACAGIVLLGVLLISARAARMPFWWRDRVDQLPKRLVASHRFQPFVSRPAC